VYVCCCVGCVRLSRCVWMRMVLDVDGEARCCRLFEGMCIWMRMVLDVDGEARCCRLVEDFFYFLLAAGWGLHV
jgi:hypothetical protein